jgi:alpha-tubulin suppressor-like RCC1 family protein
MLYWGSQTYLNDIAVAVDGSFFCGLLMAGDRENQVFCFGNNDYRQMGPNGDPGGAFADNPVSFTDSRSSGQLSIHAGANFACVVYRDGAVGCWGGNDFGQLALPLTTAYSQSLSIISSTGSFTSLSLGPYHAAACRGDGTFWAYVQNFGARLFIRAAFLIYDIFLIVKVGKK